MKKIFFLLWSSIAMTAGAVPVFNMQVAKIQPNGDTLHCLLSGDEYWHRLHDDQGFTIVQNHQSGWWVYADTVHVDRTHWNLIPTQLVPGRDNPVSAGLSPNLSIDHDTWLQRQHRYDVPKGKATGAKTSGRNHGTLNNIVIFVRFSDDSEISTSLSTINAMFNDSSATSTSMYNYFKTVSYNKIFIPTTYYPAPNGNSVVSYQDTYPRSWYMPYNATSNTNGYQSDSQRAQREFDLIERAVNYVNANSPVPTSLNLDMDGDNMVDNICFVLKGTYTGWSDLLWPHKWSLYDRNVYINGKRVYTFNFQLEGSGEHYFSTSTFCHEMFHTLGAPDLYRYETGTDVSPVGSWDLMCNNTTPPQNMGAYMKWKYGNWIDSIPEITVPGTYTLHSLGDTTYDNCAFKIAAQEPHQWYVLEYRDNSEFLETALPGSGLLIYRIDDNFDGNANYDGISYFDEVYLFRPGASDALTNGYTAQAYFSGSTARTSFTPDTDPHPWLSGGIIDTTFSITNVSAPGETISFTYSDLRGCIEPYNFRVTDLTGISATLSWNGNGNSYLVQWKSAEDNTVQSETTDAKQLSVEGLEVSTTYQWRVMGLCLDGDSSSFSSWNTFTTAQCEAPGDVSVGTMETSYNFLPVNADYNYSYSQMIYTSDELDSAMMISTVAFNYASAVPLTCKSNCTIYMGNTEQSSFSGITMSSFVPFEQLRKVYEGPLNCQQGWNEFMLDSAFFYNGIDNLVVAIDDNSGMDCGSDYKFYCTSTRNTYSSLTYYNDNNNPDPAASNNSAQKARKKYHADIRFIGCAPSLVSLSVASSDPTKGDVTGGGNVVLGSTVTITATPNDGYLFDYWIKDNDDTVSLNPYSFVADDDCSFVAYFKSDDTTVGGIERLGNEITVAVDGGTLTVQGAEGRQVMLHDLLGRRLYSRQAAAIQHIAIPYHGVFLLTVDGTLRRKIVY